MFPWTQNGRLFGVVGKARFKRVMKILLVFMGTVFLFNQGGTNYNKPLARATPKDRRLNVIIVGHGRSGTTLLGEMFNHNPSAFYLFEPLQAVIRRFGDIKKNPRYHNMAMQYLNNIFRCNFSGSPKYLYDLDDFYRRQDHPLLSFAMVSPPLCPYNITHKRWNPRKCCYLTKQRLETVCRLNYSLTAVKVLLWRVPNVDIRKLWYACASPNYDCKIIHIVRDPRAVMPSWKKNGFYKEVDRKERSSLKNYSEELCNQTVKSLNLLKSLPSRQKKDYKLVRYEDMAVNPLKILSEVYEFAGIPVIDSVKKWLRNTTHPTIQQVREGMRNSVRVIDTVKDSMAVLNNWRRRADPLEVKIVEENCRKVMDLMGYTPSNGSIRSLSIKDVPYLFTEQYEAQNWL